MLCMYTCIYIYTNVIKYVFGTIHNKQCAQRINDHTGTRQIIKFMTT